MMNADTVTYWPYPDALDQRHEAFGAPPPHEGVEAMTQRVLHPPKTGDPIATVVESWRKANDLAHECFTATLPLAVEVASTQGDAQAIEDLFHAAARLGEARLLARLAELSVAEAVRLVEPSGHA